MLFASCELIAAPSSRTSAYRGSIRFWKRRDPPRITGIGRNASHATEGAMRKNAAPMSTTVVSNWMTSFAPMSRNRSSWLTSSLRTAMRSPVERSSKYSTSRPWRCRYAPTLRSCCIDWARFRLVEKRPHGRQNDPPAVSVCVAPKAFERWRSVHAADGNAWSTVYGDFPIFTTMF